MAFKSLTIVEHFSTSNSQEVQTQQFILVPTFFLSFTYYILVLCSISNVKTPSKNVIFVELIMATTAMQYTTNPYRQVY